MKHIVVFLVFWSFVWAMPNTAAPCDVCVKFSSPEQARVFSAQNPDARLFAASSRGTLLSLSGAAQASLLDVQSWCIVRCDSPENADSLIALWRLRYPIVYAAPATRFRVEKTEIRDSLRSTQWALDVLKIDDVWKIASGKGVTVGVIDTGIDWEHEDLRTQLWINSPEDLNGNKRFDPWPVSEIRNGIAGDLDGTDNDGNGFTDDVIGYNFVDQRLENLGDWQVRDPFPYDEGSHGTNVCGVIAAARDNSKGISGIAYDARIMALRAFDISGNAEEDDIASAILYAVENGARVINCSFGDATFSALLRDASRYAFDRNVLLVASSGNSGGSDAHYPSDFPWMCSVGATTPKNLKTIFSSYNSQLSLVAPGQSIQTTDVGNLYSLVSGTSFSAPIMAAAAALLMEARPDLSPAGIRQIFERTAVPLESSKWSRLTGAGRIDVLAALEYEGEGTCLIEQPTLDATVQRSSALAVKVVATAADPLLKEWHVEIGEGMNATTWFRIESGTMQVIEPLLLTTIRADQLARDTTYTLRLRLVLSNGREIHRCTRFVVVPNVIRITSASAEQLWVGSVRYAGVRVESDRPVTAVGRLNAQGAQRSASDERVGSLHYVLLDLSGVTDTNNSVSIVVTDAGGDTATAQLRLPYANDACTDTLLRRREWQAPRLFVNPQSVAESKREFVATDVSVPARTLRRYARSGTSIRVTDSLAVPWFSRGIGDSDGDGIPEVLTYSGGDTRVVKLMPDGRFGDVVFADTLAHTFWACRFADVNGDKRDDIIGYRTGRTVKDSSGVLKSAGDALEVWAYTNGTYQKIAEHIPTSRPAADKTVNTFSSPGGAVGDFDGDGRTEIAYSDSDGDLHICEWSGSTLKTVATLENTDEADAGSEFTTELDVDGDGKPEILSGFPSTTRRTDAGDQQPSVWTFRVYAHTADTVNPFVQVWSDKFFGVRYGRPYYNGVAAGNLDTKLGDEFVLSLFPNLYVFHYNAERKSIEPLWYTAGAWSNAAMITDLDANGNNELVFTSQASARSEWWEWNASMALAPPSVFTEKRLQRDTIRCSWIPVRQAVAYRVKLRIADVNGQQSDSLFTLSSASFGVVLTQGRSAEYAVASMRSAADTISLAFGRQRFLRGSSEVMLVSAAPDIKARDIVLCAFSGSVSFASLHAGSFLVSASGNREFGVSSVVVLSDSLVALRVRGVPEGIDTLFINVRDEHGTSIYPGVRGTVMAIFTGAGSNCCDTYIKRIVALTPTSLTLEWSEPLTTSALRSDAYVSPEQTRITSLRFADSLQTLVELVFDSSKPLGTRGFVYTLSATESIESQSGRPLARGPGRMISWVYGADETSPQFAFPQPCKLSRDEYIRFAGVPAGARLVVMSVEGSELASVSARDDDGGVRWNMITDQSVRVQPGVYLFAIVYAGGSTSDKHTFIVEP